MDRYNTIELIQNIGIVVLCLLIVIISVKRALSKGIIKKAEVNKAIIYLSIIPTILLIVRGVFSPSIYRIALEVIFLGLILFIQRYLLLKGAEE